MARGQDRSFGQDRLDVHRTATARVRMPIKPACAVVALLAGYSLQAAAQDSGINGGPFAAEDLIEWAAASNKHFCMVVVGNPGTMAAAIGNASMSSKFAGGYSGTADITTTNASYRASIIAPSSFINSPNLAGPVTFQAEFSGTGVTNFFNVPSLTEVKLKNGITNIKADLTAKIEGAVFAAGNYQAELTLRCE